MFAAEGGGSGLQVNTQPPSDMIKLPVRENVFENIAQGWTPGRKAIDNEVAKKLAVGPVDQRRASFAYSEQYNVYMGLRSEIVALELVHQFQREPRVQQN